MVIDNEEKSNTEFIGGHPAVIAKFIGSYNQLPTIYEQLKQWATEHQIALRGDS